MAPQISDDESSDNLSDVELDDDISDLDEELDAMVGGNEDEDDDELLSEEEDNYKLEDPDEMDEDLELKDEEDDYEETTRPAVKPKKYTESSRVPKREAKRSLNYFDGLDESEFESTPEPEQASAPKKRKTKTTVRQDVTRPEDLDPDLILTDEEQEYNPSNQSRMTERQRKLEMGTDLVEVELDQKNQKKETKETEEEAALRKAEGARRRLDYKNKQLEEEKRDTLNKLLKRRANKTREVQDDSTESMKTLKPRRPIRGHPGLIRYRSSFNNETQLPIQTLSFN